MKRRRVLAGLGLGCGAALTAPGSLAAAEAYGWKFLENRELRLGLLSTHGGALGYLSKQGSDHNVLNHYDHGRLVQQSYYGDEDGSKWAKKPWRYNPVQGGHYQGTPAKIRKLEQVSDTQIYVATIPRHWASGALLEECLMEQWVSLDGPLVALRYRFTYKGERTHQARHQEVPAVFVDPALDTLVTYSGDAPWTGAALKQWRPGWPNEPATLSENWAAYVDQEGRGIGVYVPIASEATCYRYQGGSGSDCSYLAPITTFALEPGLEFEYRAWLTLGKTAEIRERFRKLKSSSTP